MKVADDINTITNCPGITNPSPAFVEISPAGLPVAQSGPRPLPQPSEPVYNPACRHHSRRASSKLWSNPSEAFLFIITNHLGHKLTTELSNASSHLITQEDRHQIQTSYTIYQTDPTSSYPHPHHHHLHHHHYHNPSHSQNDNRHLPLRRSSYHKPLHYPLPQVLVKSRRRLLLLLTGLHPKFCSRSTLRPSILPNRFRSRHLRLCFIPTPCHREIIHRRISHSDRVLRRDRSFTSAKITGHQKG